MFFERFCCSIHAAFAVRHTSGVTIPSPSLSPCFNPGLNPSPFHLSLSLTHSRNRSVALLNSLAPLAHLFIHPSIHFYRVAFAILNIIFARVHATSSAQEGADGTDSAVAALAGGLAETRGDCFFVDWLLLVHDSEDSTDEVRTQVADILALCQNDKIHQADAIVPEPAAYTASTPEDDATDWPVMA